MHFIPDIDGVDFFVGRFQRIFLSAAGLFFQQKNLHLSEFNGMALGLKRYGAFRQHRAVVELRLFIFQHHLAVDDVLDGRVAVYLKLGTAIRDCP